MGMINLMKDLLPLPSNFQEHLAVNGPLFLVERYPFLATMEYIFHSQVFPNSLFHFNIESRKCENAQFRNSSAMDFGEYKSHSNLSTGNSDLWIMVS
jgi:hypothetical protein